MPRPRCKFCGRKFKSKGLTNHERSCKKRTLDEVSKPASTSAVLTPAVQSGTFDEGYSRGQRRGRAHVLGDVLHLFATLIQDNY